MQKIQSQTAMLLRHVDGAHGFWGLSALVSAPQFAFRDVFSAGLYRVGLSFHTLSALLRRHNPRLAAHLAQLGVAPSMYCVRAARAR